MRTLLSILALALPLALVLPLAPTRAHAQYGPWLGLFAIGALAGSDCGFEACTSPGYTPPPSSTPSGSSSPRPSRATVELIGSGVFLVLDVAMGIADLTRGDQLLPPVVGVLELLLALGSTGMGIASLYAGGQGGDDASGASALGAVIAIAGVGLGTHAIASMAQPEPPHRRHRARPPTVSLSPFGAGLAIAGTF